MPTKKRLDFKKKTLRTLFFGIEEKKKKTGELNKVQQEVISQGLV